MSMDNLSLSDIASVTRGNDDGFGGNMGFFWIFALLLLAGGGFSGFSGGSALEQNDLQRAIDLNSIQRGQANIEARVQEVGTENISVLKDASYNNLSEIRDVQTAMNAGFSTLQNCCCETQRAIDSVNYNGAINTASINANTTEQTQKILDAISQNRMADMQNQINQLQLQNAVSGVVRYPSASTYYAGNNPFCQNTCNSF